MSRGHCLTRAAMLGGLILALLINHRSYVLDFNLVPGDLGDTRLLVFDLEHWLQVLKGHQSFFELPLFYPDPHALAYNDGWFLFAVPYAAARVVGADYFTSYQLLLPILTIVGYWAWLRILGRHLAIVPGLSILGAILLTSLNSLQVLADYGKFAAIDLFPVLILLMLPVAQGSTSSGRAQALSLAGCGTLLGLLYFTSYHPAWFFTFTLGLFLVLLFLVACLVHGPRLAIARWRGFVRQRRRALAAGLLALIVSLIPFFLTYGPAVQSGAVRGFDLVLEFSPSVKDIVNVSDLNYVWSPVLKGIGFDFGNREARLGSPIIVLLVGAAGAAILAVQLRKSGWRASGTKNRVLLLLALAAVVLVLISAKYGDFSPWYAVYRLIPGATAVRAAGRLLVLVDMIVIVLAIEGLNQIYFRFKSRDGTRRLLGVGFACLGAVLIAEQINGTTFRLDKAAQLAFMEGFEQPQTECAAFFINHVGNDYLPFGYYHLDAMMVSMHLGIPTVNGYSGFEPHKAFTLVPRGAEYQYRVLEWLRDTGGTKGICELDMRTRRFRPVDVQAEFKAAQLSFRFELLQTYGALFEAARRFVAAGHDWKDLYPEFLEDHGYLTSPLGFEIGTRYRWIEGRYWIGPRSCGNHRCVGILVTGTFEDLAPILEAYGPLAVSVHFPAEQALSLESPPVGETSGEALLLFDPKAMPAP